MTSKIIICESILVLNLNLEFKTNKNIPKKIFHDFHFQYTKGKWESVATHRTTNS